MERSSCFIVVVFFWAHSILFTGRCDGEFMYDIEVEALDPLPVTVPLMQSELGRYMYIYIYINIKALCLLQYHICLYLLALHAFGVVCGLGCAGDTVLFLFTFCVV